MLLRPSRFTTVPQMIKAVRAMAILHNMIVLERRGHFLGNRRVSAAAAARSGGGGGDDGMASVVLRLGRCTRGCGRWCAGAG